MTRHVVATTGEIPEGGRKLVSVRGRDVAVFHVNGEYFAILDRCPHEGGSLCKGKLIGLVESSDPGDYRYSRQGEIVRCAWHGWEFDLRTGRHLVESSRAHLRQYPVEVDADDVYVLVR
jgi:nitrite reductase/ring-hydroxylating ferredoxin subunit